MMSSDINNREVNNDRILFQNSMGFKDEDLLGSDAGIISLT